MTNAPDESRQYPIAILDVFAEQRLAGNQLAVVHDAADLSTAQMQAIARETNFSETTFVLSHTAGQAEVRIFTPVRELPFAGHPTVGTAWELTRGVGEIVLNLKAGPVTVEFADGIGWMTPPAVTFSGELDTEAAASLLGLNTDQIGTSTPVALAEVGPRFVLIPVRDLASLRQAALQVEARRALLDQGVPVDSIFLFTDEPYATEADYAARMFFEASGIREDPATGSANTAFAAYLLRHHGALGEVIVDQGVEMQRPSRLYLRVGHPLQVGGRVQPVITGSLRLE
ncbi:MAG: PhzF family phenazine biosynthesis protein [Pseudomonadota bacterium]